MAESEPVIYQGVRGDAFVKCIKSVLKRARIRSHYLKEILSEDALKIYSSVFTHPSANDVDNYEFYETLGDSTANNSILWYFSRRFPQLLCSKGVKVLARLKIKYVSKQTFYELAEKMDLWEFVSCSEDLRLRQKKKILEDVFEAFFGATQLILDSHFKVGVGHSVCYSIIESLYNDIDISLRYEDLFDAKTRLKETVDFFKKRGFVKVEYETVNVSEKLKESRVYAFVNGSKLFVGSGKASLQIDAEQKASEFALKKLSEMGYYKPIPSDYIC